MALVLVDLDHLKFVNDAFGHAAGDEALRGAARVLDACARRDDVLGRLGGDEFGWLLPGATPDDAVAAAERALRLAATVDMPAGGGTLLAHRRDRGRDDAVDGDTLFERADGALREGKLAGRGIARLVGADGPRRRRVTEAEVTVPTTPADRRRERRRGGRAGRRRVVGGVPLLGLRAVGGRRRPAPDGRVLRRPELQPADEDPYAIADVPAHGGRDRDRDDRARCGRTTSVPIRPRSR